MKLYDTNGWINREYMENVAKKIFHYSDYVYPRSNDVYIKTLELCDKYGTPINKLLENIYSNQYVRPIENGVLILMERYLKDGLDLSYYPARQLFLVPTLTFFNFCITNNLGIVSDMKGLNNLIGVLRTKDTINKAISLYKDANTFNPDTVFVQTLLLVGYDELVFGDPNMTGLINETVLDNILFYGSASVIKKLLDNGFVFLDRIYKLYVPCYDCHNGEQGSCNWRNVSANFVSLSRFEVPISNISSIKAEKKYPKFYVTYGMLDGEADELEVYTECGIDELDFPDEEGAQRIYRIPPVKILLDKQPENLVSMSNNIPTFCIPFKLE